jgi:hypothetical protein
MILIIVRRERGRGRDELGSSGFAVVFIELFRLGSWSQWRTQDLKPG